MVVVVVVIIRVVRLEMCGGGLISRDQSRQASAKFWTVPSDGVARACEGRAGDGVVVACRACFGGTRLSNRGPRGDGNRKRDDVVCEMVVLVRRRQRQRNTHTRTRNQRRQQLIFQADVHKSVEELSRVVMFRKVTCAVKRDRNGRWERNCTHAGAGKSGRGSGIVSVSMS
jgi:hypothetical protein